MKHIQTYILMAGLLLGSYASAQTTLYKTYVGRTGIASRTTLSAMVLR